MKNENLMLIANQLTKAAQADMSANIINQIEEGEVNPLSIQVGLSAIENVIKQVKASDIYKAQTLKEAEKYGQKSFDMYGANLQIKEVGVKYDFASCGDPTWEDINQRMESLKAEMKEREEFLKRTPKDGQTCVDENTGEVYKIYPPVKISTTSVTATFKK